MELGSGHRAVIATINLGNIKNKPNKFSTSWNFKKRNWSEFSKQIDNDAENLIKQNFSSPHELNKHICNIILKSAVQWIPKGKVQPVQTILVGATINSQIRDKTRQKAEVTKLPEDVQE